MKYSKHILSQIIALAFSISIAFGQRDIPVNMYTGQPSININLYTLSDHDLSESISLSYNVNAVKIGGQSPYGVGWNLAAGGQISRQVRGLPDDFKKVDGRQGWLYQSSYLAGFPYAAPANCTQENSDQAFFNDAYTKDTEPDIFSYTAGGISGSFVFTATGAISLIPFQDVIIHPYQPNSATGDLTITGWTITTNQGLVYSFGNQLAYNSSQACNTMRKIVKSSSTDTAGSWDQTYLTMLERDYQFYQYTAIYTHAWMLTQVTSPTGASLTYTYTAPAESPVSTTNPKYASIFGVPWDTGGTTPAKMGWFSLMTEIINVASLSISTITTSNGAYVTCGPSGFNIYEPLRSPSLFKNFILKYTTANSGTLLSSITETDGTATPCTMLPPYQFYYNPWTVTGAGSTSVDFWGYFNGANNYKSIPGGGILPLQMPTIYYYPNEPAAERYRLFPIPSYSGGPEVILQGDANLTPNPGAITSGTLSRIVYPTGGDVEFAFEANQYYDTRAGVNHYGGGLRIGSIASYAGGAGTDNDIIKIYSYLDGSGHSSGKLITRPAYALPVWQYEVPTTNYGGATLGAQIQNSYSSYTAGSTALYKAMTMVTSFDVGSLDDTQGCAIGYSQVTVSRPGSGTSQYTYAVPAAYGDASAGSSSTAWTPTKMQYARPSTCPSMNIITAPETYGYPTFPNTSYDYERGLPMSHTEYNAGGTMVRQTQYTYQYLFKSGSSPTSTTAMAYDRFANSSDKIMLFGLYSLLGDVSKTVSTVTVTTYDENNSSRSKIETSQYYYNGNNPLISKITQTMPDGTVYNKYFKYAYDFTYTGTPTDTTLLMIKNLMDANRKSILIEQWSSTQPSAGGTEKATGASLVKFRPFVLSSGTVPLPRYQLGLPLTTSVTNFAPASVNSNVFANDSRYLILGTVNEYDNYGVPLSVTSQNGTTSGSLWGYNQRIPVAQFSQARSISIGFSDFETTTAGSFSVSGGYYGYGRTGMGSNAVYPSATLTRTIARPTSATQYLLSFWLKGTPGTGVPLHFALNSSTGNFSATYTYTPTASGFQYFTQAFDVSTLSSSFTITITGPSFTSPGSGFDPSTLSPVIDDLGFYPDYATLSSVTYDFPFGPNSVTAATGNSQFTVYDGVGRPRWTLDQDHNIRERMTYAVTGQTLPSLLAQIDLTSLVPWTNSNITFVASNNTCVSGVTYQWKFDAGSWSSPSSSNLSPVQNYASPGNHTAYLKVNQANFPSVQTSANYSIISNPGTAPGLGITLTSSGADGSGWLTLTAVVSNDLGESISYQWYMRNTGDTSWNATGTNSATLTKKIVPYQSLQFQCTATSYDARYNSTTITVTN